MKEPSPPIVTVTLSHDAIADNSKVVGAVRAVHRLRLHHNGCHYIVALGYTVDVVLDQEAWSTHDPFDECIGGGHQGDDVYR